MTNLCRLNQESLILQSYIDRLLHMYNVHTDAVRVCIRYSFKFENMYKHRLINKLINDVINYADQ